MFASVEQKLWLERAQNEEVTDKKQEDEQRKYLRTVFDKIDVDRNHVLSRDEILRALNRENKSSVVSVLGKNFFYMYFQYSSLDSDGNQSIDFDEFVGWVSKVRILGEEMKTEKTVKAFLQGIFDSVDRESAGVVTLGDLTAELKENLEEAGKHLGSNFGDSMSNMEYNFATKVDFVKFCDWIDLILRNQKVAILAQFGQEIEEEEVKSAPAPAAEEKPAEPTDEPAAEEPKEEAKEEPAPAAEEPAAPSETPEKKVVEEDDGSWKVGSLVCVDKNKFGVIKYIKQATEDVKELGNTMLYGIFLTEKRGDSNGTGKGGKQFFACKEGHGMWIPERRITRAAKEEEMGNFMAEWEAEQAEAQKADEAIIARRHQLRHMKEEFKKIDVNSDKALSKEEFLGLLADTTSFTTDQAQDIFDKVDATDNGSISLAEFDSWMEKQELELKTPEQ